MSRPQSPLIVTQTLLNGYGLFPLVGLRGENIKGIALISGGIDSPVAAYLMLKKGMDVVLLHFDNRPFTDNRTMAKTSRLVERLDELAGRKLKFISVPHGENQLAFSRNCKRNLECVLCRRMMLRVGERVATVENADCIITGESLGQVASQTLKNIRVESEAVRIPVLRPLIGLDKIDIERIAKGIGTFQISISPSLCCTIVPRKPATCATIAHVKEEEGKIDIDALVSRSLTEMRVQ